MLRATPMVTRPYPYDRWAKLTHKQRTIQLGLRALWNETSVLRARDTARTLLGRDLDVQLGLSAFGDAAQLQARMGAGPSTAIALLLEPTASALPVPWLVEISNHDAQSLVDRTLGGEGVEVPPPSLWPLDELSRGALGYVAARVLAALGGELALRDVAQLPLPASVLPDCPCVIWPITLRLGSQTLTLRAFVPESFTPSPGLAASPVRDLGALPLTLIASAGRTRLPLTAAKSLALGDVVVLDETGLVHEQDQVRGVVLAALAGSGSCISCSVAATGLSIVEFTRAQEPTMTTGRIESPLSTESGEARPSPDFAADAAIELSLEVARFSLTLAELQRLRAGDVLVTGRRVGERVSLRVSGQPFAEGELVDVEGEVGVRILSFSQPG